MIDRLGLKDAARQFGTPKRRFDLSFTSAARGGAWTQSAAIFYAPCMSWRRHGCGACPSWSPRYPMLS